ncbi:Bug family tripartite tricarboxylate transporter substrate binding protein [Paracandidimonas soli]|uniref:Tripartite-type tricarboxylate transporter receptor subunit TctC n=1 Tax=Paracandidimonas soli TaxID=1917182 RepID=A0A4R3UNV4_9BURK|nr:tripartite tricarboxylate transporter substrate binding protein [Paracandidimonas soli]TCU92260.1 tripartite-type tricarboxylate transporter receptor subunit TctC [Paracandidimonas soli]
MKQAVPLSRILSRLLCSTLLLLPFSAVQAETWPERPIRLLVPYAPGGSSDVVARAVAAEMSKDLGQQVIVENKGGAQGTIATTEVARARPDGYTLILGHVGTLAVNPSMVAKLSYDPKRDFAPIVLLAKLPMIFAVGGGVDANDLPSFVALAKSRPGALNYGSAGSGSAGHLAFEMLKTATGIDVTHVPYKGTGAALSDLLGGFIDAASAGTPGLLPSAQAGKIKLIAVGSRQRLDVLPDVPTVEEQGYPGFESSQWFGLLAPAGTPAGVIERLHRSALAALESESVRTRLEYDSSEISGAGPAEFATFIDTEERRWGTVVRSARLSVE